MKYIRDYDCIEIILIQEYLSLRVSSNRLQRCIRVTRKRAV